MSHRSRQRQKSRATEAPAGFLAKFRRRYTRVIWIGMCLLLVAMFFHGTSHGPTEAAETSTTANAAATSGTSTATPEVSLRNVRNGDFETAGSTAWYSLKNPQWGGFLRSGERDAATGQTNHFARVRADVAMPPAAIKVFGLVQEIRLTDGVPDHWDFDMRVARENKLCSKQYAQVVAIHWPGETDTPGAGNVQLRCVLHGVDSPPYQMGNARFHMNPEFKSIDNSWRNYRLPLRKWFEEAYPAQDFSAGRLRILMEARYDDMPASAKPGEVALEVDYDNVDFIWD